MPYIKEKADYEYMIDSIISSGTPRLNTYEIIGQTVKTDLQSNDLIDVLSIPKEMIRDFFTALDNGEKVKVGPYDTSYYLFISKAFEEMLEVFKDDSVLTRRAILQFPASHCFQSIQFLVNSSCLNVVCQMRSCNAEDNLPMDMLLASGLGDQVREFLKKKFGLPIENQALYMQIGSLHCYVKKGKRY